jgi:hexosaminidase
MNKKIYSFLQGALVVACSWGLLSTPAFGQSETGISIIPQPQSLTLQTGNFILTPDTRIYVDTKKEDLSKMARLLAADLQKITGNPITVINKKPNKKAKNAIFLTLKGANDTLGVEGWVSPILMEG